MPAMKNLLEDLLERASGWSDEAQAELVEAMVEIEAKHSGVYRLNDEERAAVRRGLEEVREGKFASDDAVKAVFDRYRRG
jgi:predicted transcriptional regulator